MMLWNFVQVEVEACITFRKGGNNFIGIFNCRNFKLLLTNIFIGCKH